MFASTKLCWDKEYATHKFLPLLTRWHLMNDHHKNQTNISLNKIVKKRINKGISCYEIKWNNFEMTTLEPQTAVQICYAKEVSIYESAQNENKKKKKKGY